VHHAPAAGSSLGEDALVFLAVVAFTLVFVWAFYAVKRRFRERGRRELGLPGGDVAALRAGGAVRMPPTSLVLLSRGARPLSRELVAEAARRAWGVEEISDDESESAHWVFGQTEQLVTLSVEGSVFTVVSLPEAYKMDRDWYISDETPAELLSVWQQHHAWLSVDVAALGRLVTVQVALDQIGKLMAELADDQTLAVVRPAARHAVLFDEEVRQLLRVRPASEVVSGTPVSLVILQRERRAIDEMGAKEFAERVNKAWNAELPTVPASASADFCALSAEGGGAAFIQHRGIRLAVTTPPGFYARDLGDNLSSAVSAALRAHQGWCSVEMTAAPVGVGQGQVYGLLGKLAAALIDESALMVVAPALRRGFAVTPELLEALRCDNPLPALDAIAAL
jgi:hypothetical protein